MKTLCMAMGNGLAAAAALAGALLLAGVPALTGCSEVSNNPHPLGSERMNTFYFPFRERSPKYLDPTSSYSNDESPFTYQVYEPLYGYHYLKPATRCRAMRRAIRWRKRCST
jgi:ABC-type transport system substrate-binding protein